MPITYTSKHHSPEDPGGIIREVLNMGTAFTGTAREVLLGWTLRLDDNVDPAAAARTLLQRYGYADRPPPDGACGELVMLLRETASYPQGRLDTHLCRPEPARRRARRADSRKRR